MASPRAEAAYGVRGGAGWGLDGQWQPGGGRALVGVDLFIHPPPSRMAACLPSGTQTARGGQTHPGLPSWGFPSDAQTATARKARRLVITGRLGPSSSPGGSGRSLQKTVPELRSEDRGPPRGLASGPWPVCFLGWTGGVGVEVGSGRRGAWPGERRCGCGGTTGQLCHV